MMFVANSKEELEAVFLTVLETFIKRNGSIIPKDDKREEDLLTVKEALQLLKISNATFIRLRKREEVKTYKLGHGIRFKKSEILNLQSIKS